jgi:hypothetical protein
VLFTGCSAIDGLDRALDSATGAAAEGLVGPTEGHGSAPAASGGGMPPPMAMHGYTMALFQVMFYQGGYNLTKEPFEPGEYVRWEATGMAQGDWFEKALLKRRTDGSEWWRVATHSEDGTLTIEALFGPAGEDGNRRVRRMRVQYPGEAAQEVPVSEQQSDKWVLHARRTLTPESYKGLKVGVADLSVPAGSFTADHLRTAHPGQGGTVHWWVSEQVPGGIVKYLWESEGERHLLELKEFGSDAGGSRLGAF